MNPCNPPPNMEAPIDLLFRNGEARRNTTGKQWRWGLWSGPNKHIGPTDHDIVKWQPAGSVRQADTKAWTAVSGGYA